METLTDLRERHGDGEEDGYDAVVVGSGYGGSVAAYRLSTVGIKVCLVEKGRRWEAEGFPRNSLETVSAARIESRKFNSGFGRKDALFQVYEQNDSLAVVACGLGGGSLVNAGVMLPTPVCAKRNPKWPKEWDICEASATAMLRIQNVPVKFSIAKIMGEIAEEEIGADVESSLKLSVNIDQSPSTLSKLQNMGSYFACGNCIAGCPYNAKNSTDKNYLRSAVQAFLYHTEDGYVIKCRQWKCNKYRWYPKGEKLHPVLLLNGYSSESYWLPTEPHDFVRTLLE